MYLLDTNVLSELMRLHPNPSVVIRNVQHFDHVIGLRVENWFVAA